MTDPPLTEGHPPLAPATEAAPHEVALWPGWEWWRGVNGLWYARWVKSTPPKVIRAGTPGELIGRIRAAERRD